MPRGKPDEKNAEVTSGGIKSRGTSAKGKQNLVVVGRSSTAKLKQKFLYIGTTVLASAVGVCLSCRS